MRLILASASPRRADLLRAAGLAFETLAVDVDERQLGGEAPETYVRRLAGEKSARAWSLVHGCAQTASGDPVILGADTVVVVDGAVLGKPRDDNEARAMMSRLSGRRHEVLTGVSLRRGEHEAGRVGVTDVFFARLSIAEIEWYVQTREGRDKAGAYAIQGLASRFVQRIEGSYSNVVGLPVALVYELLQNFNGVPAVLASGG